jgi:hypothetical protein
MPAPPPGRKTVMGGQIATVDTVRDQIALKVAGGHTVKILFDERTQVYQNGKKISVLNLHPEDHASVETTLDGTAIFAVRIHLLSDFPDGELRGQVLSFNSGTGELKVRDADSNAPMTLLVAPATPVARVGQAVFTEQHPGSADLMHGSLVDVFFKAGKTGPGAVTHVDVLAVPGAEFIFRGNLASLDLRAGRMSIAGTNNEQPMDIAFEPSRFAVSHDLHTGSLVKVTVRFDGSHYVASEITPE